MINVYRCNFFHKHNIPLQIFGTLLRVFLLQPTVELSWHMHSNLQQKHFIYHVYRRSVILNALAFDRRVAVSPRRRL